MYNTNSQCVNDYFLQLEYLDCRKEAKIDAVRLIGYYIMAIVNAVAHALLASFIYFGLGKETRHKSMGNCINNCHDVVAN